MKNCFLSLCLLFLISCQKDKVLQQDSIGDIILSERNDSVEVNDTSYYCPLKKQFLPFFNFDEVTYYHIDLSLEDWLDRTADRKPLSSRDKKIKTVYESSLPLDLSDKKFLKAIEDVYSNKVIINEKDLNAIDSIFSEKYKCEPTATTCLHYYRDILVFKKDNKISGMAKICFSCGDEIFAGTNRNTDDFGNNGDYEKLRNILKQYLPSTCKLRF